MPGGRTPYLGPRAVSGGRTPYLGPRTVTSGRTPYLGGASGSVVPPTKHSGGGFLHGLGGDVHWIATKTGLAAHDLAQMPGGIIGMGRTEYNALKSTVEHPWVTGKQKQALLHEWTHPLAAPQKDDPQAAALNYTRSLAKGSLQSLEHPGRDPFQTALTVSALLGVGGSAAARAGAVAKTGELGAALRTPEFKPTMLHLGDKRQQVQLGSPSRSAVGSAVKQGYAKTLQASLDNPEPGRVARTIASHATRRVGGSLNEDVRARARVNDLPAAELDIAARRLGVKGTPGARDRIQQAALELTNTQTTPEEAAAYHMRMAAEQHDELQQLRAKPELSATDVARMKELKDSIPRNRGVAKIYDKVAERGYTTLTPDNRVAIDAEQHPALAHADAKVKAASGKGDEILTDYGVRTPEELRQAVNAPAQYRAGARFVRSTRARLGIKSPAVERQEGRVAALQSMHDTALRNMAAAAAKKAGPEDVVIGSRIVGPGRRFPARPATTRIVQQARTAEEAHGRLTALEKAHTKQLDTMAHAHFGPIDKGEAAANAAQRARFIKQQSGRDKLGRLSGASSAKAEWTKTPAELRRDQMEQMALDAAKKNPEAPGAADFLGRVGEIDKLRAALNPEMFEPIDKSALGTKPVQVTVPGRPGYQAGGHAYQAPGATRAERIGGALSMERDRLERMQAAAARRIEPTGVVGGEGARPGRGFMSYQSFEKNAPKTAAASTAGSVVGEAREPIISAPNTGRNMSLGIVPKDVTGAVAGHYRRIARYLNTVQHREAVVRTGTRLRKTNRDVLVKEPGADEFGAVSNALKETMGQGHITHDTVEGIYAALDAREEDMMAPAENRAHKADLIGAPAPKGHVWVDRNVLGDLGRQAAGRPGHFLRGVQNVNSAVTAATVYYKIGHAATRGLTNATTNLMQGSLSPRALRESVQLFRELSPTDRQRMLAVGGQHGFMSMPHEGQGRIAAAAAGGARWWARRVDAPSRFASVAYEARQAGFRTPDQIRHFLDAHDSAMGARNGIHLSAAEHMKVTAVGRRANRASIMYDGINEQERRILTRAVWFYPWLKGATRWIGHTALEHPVKTGVVGTAAVQARKQQMKSLGSLPSYEGQLVPLRGGPRPLVMDPSTFTPYGTGANILNAVERPKQLEGFLNPVASGAAHLFTGTDQYGQQTKQPYTAALASIGAAAPEYQLGAAWLHRHQNQANRMFRTTPGSVFIRSLAGPGWPRRLNPPAGHKSYGREVKGR